ncbi:pyridoxamine 5'-phosphate oxidase family protein [Fundidesulfovibrio terrae]|uniref:pyridoxamine 5'-phosphate oxidase family protein n=1 Tax=Fundidesulfovibrio terrae TaxID=2922866 RepID=UPI001FAF3574|nr:pyridoxamine 5'-phosphate oxidase family protein [Fundidesulfovibrio terrae]
MTILDDMARLILDRNLCVLATSSDGMPHASPMFCMPEPDLEYIHMATLANTRKWANIAGQPQHGPSIEEGEPALTVGSVLATVKGTGQRESILVLLETSPPPEGFPAGVRIRADPPQAAPDLVFDRC